MEEYLFWKGLAVQGSKNVGCHNNQRDMTWTVRIRLPLPMIVGSQIGRSQVGQAVAN